jgi:hypothetical protein
MSGTAPQSLASLVDTAASGTPGAAPSGTGIPSLSGIIDQSSGAFGVAPLPVGTSAAPATDTAPVAGQLPTQATAPAAATPQQQAALRQLLSQRGFNVPDEFSTDDQVADLIASEIDAAVTLRESQEFQQFRAWQSQQSQPGTAAQTTPAPAQTAPEITEAKILSAITDGYIAFDQNTKKWVPNYPQFTTHADAVNARSEQKQQTKINLASDPQDYIRQQIDEAVKGLKPQSEVEELKQVLQELKQERINTQWAQVDQWISQNNAKIFSAPNVPTPYGNLYLQFEEAITKSDPSFDTRPLERHNEVLRRLAVAEQAFRPTQQPATQQQALPPAARPSFLDGAARRNGTNRLSEYTGPASNAVGPQVPMGKAGTPSLSGIINQMTTLGSN